MAEVMNILVILWPFVEKVETEIAWIFVGIVVTKYSIVHFSKISFS